MDDTAAGPDARGRREPAACGGLPVVHGIVVHGDGRGRQLGHPTANVFLTARQRLPADGVYAGTYERPDGSRHPALISLGRRPTFYERGERVLEAHLLDFDDSLYGESAAVTFMARLGDQQRFDSVTVLIGQLRQYAAAARVALAARGVERSVR